MTVSPTARIGVFSSRALPAGEVVASVEKSKVRSIDAGRAMLPVRFFGCRPAAWNALCWPGVPCWPAAEPNRSFGGEGRHESVGSLVNGGRFHHLTASS